MLVVGLTVLWQRQRAPPMLAVRLQRHLIGRLAAAWPPEIEKRLVENGFLFMLGDKADFQKGMECIMRPTLMSGRLSATSTTRPGPTSSPSSHRSRAKSTIRASSKSACASSSDVSGVGDDDEGIAFVGVFSSVLLIIYSRSRL